MVIKGTIEAANIKFDTPSQCHIDDRDGSGEKQSLNDDSCLHGSQPEKKALDEQAKLQAETSSTGSDNNDRCRPQSSRKCIIPVTQRFAWFCGLTEEDVIQVAFLENEWMNCNIYALDLVEKRIFIKYNDDAVKQRMIQLGRSDDAAEMPGGMQIVWQPFDSEFLQPLTTRNSNGKTYSSQFDDGDDDNLNWLSSTAFSVMSSLTAPISSMLGNSKNESNDEQNVLIESLHGGPVGLSNLGNTCFMNSMLQCLYHTLPLRDYLLSGQHIFAIDATIAATKSLSASEREKVKLQAAVIQELARLMRKMYLCPSSSRAISPGAFKTALGRYHFEFAGYQQNDSFKAMSAVFTCIQDVANLGTGRFVRHWKCPLLSDSTRSPSHLTRMLGEETRKLLEAYQIGEDSILSRSMTLVLSHEEKCAHCKHPVQCSLDITRALTIALSPQISPFEPKKNSKQFSNTSSLEDYLRRDFFELHTPLQAITPCPNCNNVTSRDTVQRRDTDEDRGLRTKKFDTKKENSQRYPRLVKNGLCHVPEDVLVISIKRDKEVESLEQRSRYVQKEVWKSKKVLSRSKSNKDSLSKAAVVDNETNDGEWVTESVRESYNVPVTRIVKDSTAVLFPIELDLEPFLQIPENEATGSGAMMGYKYKLYALNHHFGGTDGGHWSASAYNQTKNAWFDLNDSSAYQTSMTSGRSEGGTGVISSSSANIAMYQRIK